MDPRPGPADPLSGVEAELDSLAERPLDEHEWVFAGIHSTLTSALAATAADGVDSRSGPSGPPPPGR